MNKEIVKMYSENDNIDICIEECGELIHALSKYKRSKGYGYLTKTTQKEAYTNLVQAVADVLNAIESVSHKIGLNKYDIVFEVAKADAKARRNIYGETEEENEDTLASVKRYWFKKALKKDEEKQEEIAKNEFYSEKCTMKSEKHPEKQAKNEFHSEKCSIKNNDAYLEPYWIEEEIGGKTIIRKPFIPTSTRKPFIPCNGQLYYYVNADRIVSATCFLGSIEDKLKIAIGNCFKTSEQAQANVDIIMKRLKKAKEDWDVVIIDK